MQKLSAVCKSVKYSVKKYTSRYNRFGIRNIQAFPDGEGDREITTSTFIPFTSTIIIKYLRLINLEGIEFHSLNENIEDG